MEVKKLSEIACLLNGYAFKSTKYVESGIRIIRIANVQDGFITDDKPCYYPPNTDEDISKYLLAENDLLVSLTGNVGRVGMLSKSFLPAALNQRVSCIRIKDSKNVDKKYLYYYFRQKVFVKECVEASKGVAQLNLSTKWLENYMIPLPPLPEQERVVARIEELFSQLDAGVETLKKTKAQLAVYRQAVLKEAFEGDYQKRQLSDFSKAISGYAFKSSKYSLDGEFVVVKIGNVKERRFDFSRDLTKTIEADDSILEKYLLHHGDCLITMTGTRGKRDYGFVSMVKDQNNYLLNQRVAALRFDQSVALPEFFQYYLASPSYRDMFFGYETGNVGQGNVGIKALLDPFVILPDIETQKRIVGDIESKLSVCDSIEKTVDMALQQAEAMRQSILKDAFEGRL